MRRDYSWKEGERYEKDRRENRQDLKKIMQEKIKEILKQATGLDIDIPVAHTDDFKNGDYASPVAFVLAKQWKISPKEAALKVFEKLTLPKEIKKVEVAGNGYLNFFLSDEYISHQIKKIDSDFGKNDMYKGKEIMVEYTNPNPFKVFHIGHLMNNAIGESYARLIEFGGAKVIRDCYQGDVGLHVAKAIWSVLKGNFQNTIEFWGKAYVEGNNEYENHKAEIDELNKKIFEKSDPEINKYYDLGRALSLEYFESIYKKLDTHFDKYFFESEVAQEGIKMVKDNPQVFEQSEGAVVFKGSHTRVFLNSKGLPTYEAKELGLTATKFKQFPHLDFSLIITANEQNDYFKVVREALAKIDSKYSIRQFGHGMMRLADGKMSSRKGNIVSAEDLISDIQTVIKEKNPESDSEKIAIAAIKYSILRQAVGGDIIYDKEKSVSFEGDSGPYLQYSCVRAKSVLAKATATEIKEEIVGTLDRMILRFPEIVLRAQTEYAPHHIVTYLTQLAGEFNGFYAHQKILESGYRLALTKAFIETMQNGLKILAIQVPSSM